MSEMVEILFTHDFDVDEDSDESRLIGWRKFVGMTFDVREDFRAVVNFQGAGLKRLLEDDETTAKLRSLVKERRIFIGNHSWSHPSFTGRYTGEEPLSRAEQADELLTAHEFISKELGEPIFFRAPFFDHDDNTLQLARQLGMRYDLSGYITEDKFEPVEPYEYRLTGEESLIRLDTNLRLSPIEWREDIKIWDGGELERGMHCVATHPYEFIDDDHSDVVCELTEKMLALDCLFAGPSEIYARLKSRE